MQLLDSLPNQQSNSSFERLMDALQDIASKVQIQSNLCISHPDYGSLETTAEVAARFQELPVDFQNQYLSLKLRSFLYDIYYANSYGATLTADASSVSSPLYQNTVRGLNLELDEQLHASNCSKGYFDPGWSVLRQEGDGSLAVQKNGLTLHVKRDRHLQSAEQSATAGEVVAIWMPPNLFEDGFYVAVSDVGLANRPYLDGDPKLADIYFNLSPEGAVAVMASLTQQLNAIRIPFTFKVLYDPDDYERCDSGVLCFERNNYQAVRQVVQTVYTENQSHFRSEVPLFTKLLALGLGLAEKPDDREAAQESFGMNRCQIIANGLLEAWRKGDDSPEGRMTSIHQQFSRLGIELQRPYLNANSEDIYTPLH